jgi:hypothetical protein
MCGVVSNTAGLLKSAGPEIFSAPMQVTRMPVYSFGMPSEDLTIIEHDLSHPINGLREFSWFADL